MTTVSKGYKGIGMDGFIARWYARDALNNLPADQKDARKLAATLREGAAALDLAPGHGYLAIEVAKLGRYDITGLDISETFVEIARANAEAAGVGIDFRLGNASNMPFADNTFDAIVCRAAFKNFSEPVAALDEMHRTLKPGGRALIIDLRNDAPPEAIDEAVNNMGLNAINTWLTKMAFRTMLCKRAYSKVQFREMASRSRFKTCQMEEDLIGLDVWLVRNKSGTRA